MTKWRTGPHPSENQVKAVYPGDRRHHEALQNYYAGGKGNRRVECHDGQYRTGAIKLRPPRARSRRSYAELVWAKSDPNRAGSILVCEADQPNREANLAKAWQIVNENTLTMISSRQAWRTRTKQSPAGDHQRNSIA